MCCIQNWRLVEIINNMFYYLSPNICLKCTVKLRIKSSLPQFFCTVFLLYLATSHSQLLRTLGQVLLDQKAEHFLFHIEWFKSCASVTLNIYNLFRHSDIQRWCQQIQNLWRYKIYDHWIWRSFWCGS